MTHRLIDHVLIIEELAAIIKAKPAAALKDYAVVDVRGDDFVVNPQCSTDMLWDSILTSDREAISSQLSTIPARLSTTM